MNVLFLDCDGVLNCTYTFERRRHLIELAGETCTDEDLLWPLGHLDYLLVPLLNPIVEQTSCKIVVSSSWRLHPRFPEFGSWLSIRGFKYPNVIIGRTPVRDQTQHSRGKEIKAWLDEHPEVRRYAIVDDDGEDIIPLHPNNYIFTNANEGLTNEKVEAIVEMLAPTTNA